MSVSFGMIWEVRTTGSDSNSGGFRGGAVLSTPSAPTCTPAGTGGTVAAGNYYIVVTEVDGNGETPKSGQTLATTSGTTSKITITAPTNPSVQGSRWNVYCGTASGGPYFLESSAHLFGVNYDITSTPPTSGTQAPGADRSQQDSAQVVIDGSTINGTSGGATATMTLTGYTPTSADVGNAVQVLTGTNATAGVYEIVGWSSTTWVLDSNWCSGAVTSCTGRMGGAFATPGKANSVKIDYNRVFVKSGTYTISSGIADAKIAAHWVGYNTTRSVTNTDSSPPVWDAGANSVLMLSTTFQQCLVNNISFTNSTAKTGAEALSLGGGNSIGRYIRADSMTALYAIEVSNGTLDHCSITTSKGFGISSGTLLFCTVSASSAGLAPYQIQGGCLLYRCVALNCLSNNPDFDCSGGPPSFINCLSYGNQSGSNAGGFNLNNITGWLYNCIAYHNSGVGFSFGSGVAGVARVINCAGGDNTQGNSSTGANVIRDTQAVGFLTLTASPFTNAAANDFSLNNTAGGGGSLRAAGYSGSWPVMTGTTGYPDVGPAQHQDAGSGGGATLARVFLGMGG